MKVEDYILSAHIQNQKWCAAKFILFIAVQCFVIITLRAQSDSVSTGMASYYAHKFQGRRTASGELFDQDRLTAAHKYLSFGTQVQVTNLSNDSTVIVTINDRLPKSSSRMIDLSYSAAQQLNFVRKGLTKVRIELMPPVATPDQNQMLQRDSTGSE